jgi:hypothetical protein
MCEFMATPLACSRRGNPPQADAKRRGGFSLVRFFVPHKEMNVIFLYAAITNVERNAADERFWTACKFFIS